MLNKLFVEINKHKVIFLLCSALCLINLPLFIFFALRYNEAVTFDARTDQIVALYFPISYLSVYSFMLLGMLLFMLIGNAGYSYELYPGLWYVASYIFYAGLTILPIIGFTIISLTPVILSKILGYVMLYKKEKKHGSKAIFKLILFIIIAIVLLVFIQQNIKEVFKYYFFRDFYIKEYIDYHNKIY